MKVVFDYNILIEALLFPGCHADAAVTRVFEGRDELIFSRAYIREVVSVAALRFSRDREELSRVAVVLEEVGTLVEPSRRLSVFWDASDNRILECAVEGKAEVIVTGDKAMLAIGGYEATQAIALDDYLDKKG